MYTYTYTDYAESATGKCRTGICGTKYKSWKIQDWDVHDQMSLPENAGPENEGPRPRAYYAGNVVKVINNRSRKDRATATECEPVGHR